MWQREGLFRGDLALLFWDVPSSCRGLPQSYLLQRSRRLIHKPVCSIGGYLQRGDQTIVLREETSYPEEGKVTLSIAPKKPAEIPLHLRVPGWEKSGVPVTINGSAALVNTQPGAWATIKRFWKPGYKVELQIPLELTLAQIDRQHPKRVAVTRGPLVLVRQGQQSPPGDFSQWKMAEKVPMTFDVGPRQELQFIPFCRIRDGEPYLMYFDLGV
jgi:hypothetical protein